ncbi:MAG: glucosamine-6-phosphate deaminase [Planctomycetia bacterium]|nr:glucosamine-6-phosphate deaminase [Planctomycetia bacterium]
MLKVKVCDDRATLGAMAAKQAASAIRDAIQAKGNARVIFAAAPSQNEMLAALVQEKGIDWSLVTALHMDEYIGLPKNSPARFSYYLHRHCFDLLPFGKICLLDDGTENVAPDVLCARYNSCLAEGPIDVVCMGIGENGHIAFNDPPVADFNDPLQVKIVTLDEACRRQQVNDGCFPDFDSVPKQAITLTVPTLMGGICLVCSVPGRLKRKAVTDTISAPISTDCPATILRTHSNATLFVDHDSYAG